MPISIVIGGQFGSEGKGKVALEVARRSSEAVTVVRVGGPNSGHTAFDRQGKRWALRQMPAACVDKDVDVVFPEGSYIEPELLLSEIVALNYPRDRIFISEHAKIIMDEHKAWEADAGLTAAIGSTGSGVGGAVMALAARRANNFTLPSMDAGVHELLHRFTCDVATLLSKKLARHERIIIEGTQGFGLSLLEGAYWPKVTSRITTAAGALAEAGLSPRDVDSVTLVLRSFPIRVAGDSGPLYGETDWDKIAIASGRIDDLTEYTTVTKKVRRVGVFDSTQVRRAINANTPDEIVLNHLDYISPQEDLDCFDGKLQMFIAAVEEGIGRKIAWYGFSPSSLVQAGHIFA